MPRTAFIVAADEDMIRHAVEHHFHKPSQTHVADYLDKLIQIPMRVPRVGVQETRVYLFLLLCSREIKSKENLEKTENLPDQQTQDFVEARGRFYCRRCSWSDSTIQ